MLKTREPLLKESGELGNTFRDWLIGYHLSLILSVKWTAIFYLNYGCKPRSYLRSWSKYKIFFIAEHKSDFLFLSRKFSIPTIIQSSEEYKLKFAYKIGNW